MSVLLHELGRCLGLQHAGLTPTWNARLALWGWQEKSAVFSGDPVMSYGWGYPLTYDDRIGASLLGPAPVWVRTTGSVAGEVIRAGARRASSMSPRRVSRKTASAKRRPLLRIAKGSSRSRDSLPASTSSACSRR